MLKISFNGLLCFLLVACLGACNGSGKQADTEDVSQKPQIYVTNYPLFYFTERIGADQVELFFPASKMSDPSMWNPDPEVIAVMQMADLIIMNGASYEKWLMNVTIPSSIVVNTSRSFTDRFQESDETFTHSHGDEGAHEHKGTASTTWLDLSLAVEQANAVKQALIKIKPQLEVVFNENFEELKNELQMLDEQFRDAGNGNPQPFVVFSHPVYQYFQYAYMVEGISMHWEADQSMVESDLHDIGHLLENEGAIAVVWESEPLKESREALFSLGVKSVVIEPCGGTPKSGNFMDVMASNLAAFESIFHKGEMQ